MTCRHCHTRRALKPRGLCSACYYTQGVRDLYPSTSKFARRGVSDFNGRTAPPNAATEATPGSEDKILVLQKRCHARVSLWHPDDKRRNDE